MDGIAHENLAFLIIVFSAFIVSFLPSKVGPKELIKITGQTLLVFVLIVVIAFVWRYDPVELLTLQTGGRGGVAIGIMYGSILGLLVSALIALAQGRSER